MYSLKQTTKEGKKMSKWDKAEIELKKRLAEIDKQEALKKIEGLTSPEMCIERTKIKQGIK